MLQYRAEETSGVSSRLSLNNQDTLKVNSLLIRREYIQMSENACLDLQKSYVAILESARKRQFLSYGDRACFSRPIQGSSH
jgi:hypothetical protein